MEERSRPGRGFSGAAFAVAGAAACWARQLPADKRGTVDASATVASREKMRWNAGHCGVILAEGLLMQILHAGEKISVLKKLKQRGFLFPGDTVSCITPRGRTPNACGATGTNGGVGASVKE
jgi:archaellum component FlaF (FlaF/FlaG flagellin family)